MQESTQHQASRKRARPVSVPNRNAFSGFDVMLFFICVPPLPFLISIIKGTVNQVGKTRRKAANSENGSFQTVQLGAGKVTRDPVTRANTVL